MWRYHWPISVAHNEVSENYYVPSSKGEIGKTKKLQLMTMGYNKWHYMISIKTYITQITKIEAVTQIST